MKKILLLAVASSLFLFSCKDDGTVTPGGDGTGNGSGFKTEQKQKSAGFYFSGNWCGPCGLYGKPALHNMSNKYGNDFAYIACQLNGSGATDPFNCADANSMAGAFGVSGVPTIQVGAAGDQFQAASGGTDMETKLDGYLAANKAKTPVANIAVSYVLEDGAISVTTETEFFEETSDDYQISVYLVESKLIANQYVSGSGWAKDVEFNNVLRTKLSASVVGDAFPAGTKAKGHIETMTFGDFLQSTWKTENLHVVAVL